MTKFYNVCTRKTIHLDKGDKTLYHKVGIVKVTENGGWFLQLYHQPETDFLIFPNHNDELPVINFDGNEA